ncbi:MATE efflux family protein [Klebsormidium nitens]|uniref:Protein DETOXIFICATION n=1 Tax=Klebsormidium nitens TaxID=105231 RepID=A0A1Y1HYF6_KLENI|nr:MATE efflux family protein [Klebsormidium nitens]|eukprot:GAQ81567.1 MATE efflux family protein [Klebsormidium nitens]
MGPALHAEGSGPEVDSILSDVRLSSNTSPEPHHRHIGVPYPEASGSEPREIDFLLSRSEAPIHIGHRHEVPVHTGRQHVHSQWSDGDDSEGEEERLLLEGPVHTGRQNGEVLRAGNQLEGHVHIGSRHKVVRWSDGTEWSVEEGIGVNGASRRQVFAEVAKQGALAGPIMGMNVVWFLRSIVSMIFLGRLGELELAAGSLAISLANVTGYSILYGLSTGLEPLISQAYGAKRYHTMGRILNRGIVILLFACIPIIVIWANAESLLLLMKQDPGISREAGRYLRWMIPDLIALAGAQPVRVYLRSQGLTFPLIPCAVIAFIFHVPINFLLIFGLKLGAAGAALASGVTDFNLLFLMVLYIRCLGVHKKSWTGFSIRSCFSEWGPFLRLAAPSCVATCLEWWCYELLLLFAGLLKNPVESVAVMSVCLNFGALAYMVPAAMSSSLSARVGNELGANSPFFARLATQVAGWLSVFLGGVSALILILTRHQIGRLFTDNEDLLKMIASILPLVALCHVADSPQTTLSGALRGMARPTIFLVINLASYYGFGMPVALFLAFHAHLGVPGMWMGLFCAQIVQVILVCAIVFRTDWPMQAAKAQELTCQIDENDSKESTESLQKGLEMGDVEKQEVSDIYGHEDD